MTEDVIKKLSKKDDRDPFHEALLDHARRLIKMSRTEMAKRYCDWDLQDRVFRGERCPDLDDRKQMLKGKPEKMIVPNTFAQVMTFCSFQFLLFNQNRNFYELNPNGPEDYASKRQDSELLLARDLRHNMWNTKLFQHLLDIARFGPGILETCWTRKTTQAFVVPPPRVQNVLGIPAEFAQPGQWQEFLKFEGNEITNVSPYRWFPDTRHALVDFQKGEFCASEEEYSMAQLYDMQKAGEVVGVEHIEPLLTDYAKFRGADTRWSMRDDDKNSWRRFDAGNKNSVALVSKMQLWIVPKNFKYGNDESLGPEEFPILYTLWYANDNRIIRLEPAYSWHNEFNWTLAQFTPDMHHTLTLGLADLVYRLQDVISWLINSHITSVRRVIGNRLIVDPRVIDTKTLDGEGDIYIKKGMNVPLDRAVGQLKVTDVTSGHMTDADLLSKVMETVTGVNGNMQGQYNSGRRSAQEARVVTGGAAGRMKMHAHLIWESSLGRLGRLMHSNLRQSLGFESYQRCIGQQKDIEQRYAIFKGTPEEVICGDDFFVFDSTLSSEKGFMAQSLQELLVAIMSSNPTAAFQLTQNINPLKLLDEIQYLRGSGPVSRFEYTEEEKMQQMQQMLLQQQMQGPTTQPGTEAAA